MNALLAIGQHLQAGQCRPFTSDTAVRIAPDQVRYPDLGIDCGTFRGDSFEADAPHLVVEVLSDSTRAFDFVGKLEEYKSVATLRHIVLVDSEEAKIIHWTYAEGGAWAFRTHEGLGSVPELADPGITLPVAVLYAGVSFRPRPRLMPGDTVSTGEPPNARGMPSSE